MTSAGTLEAVAAFGLAGTAHSLPDQPLDDAAWDELRVSASTKRLSGLLLNAIDSGALPASDEQQVQAVEDQVHSMSGALVLEDLLLRVTELFSVNGVASRALKGSAVAHLDYGSPHLRAFGDVDVLVRSDDFDRAAVLLGEAGMQRMFQPPRPGWDKRYGKGAMFRSGDGLEVDLHRTFCTPPLGLRIDLADVWAESDALLLDGQVVEALTRELRLLNAAYSGAVGDTDPKLSTLRDIVELALHPSLDTRRVRDLAARWKGQAVLAYAVNAAWRTLRVGDVTALSNWAERYRPSADEQRELALYQQRRSSETARALATARMLPSMSSRAGYLWALARPDAAFRQASDRGPVRRLTHGLADLRRARRPL